MNVRKTIFHVNINVSIHKVHIDASAEKATSCSQINEPVEILTNAQVTHMIVNTNASTMMVVSNVVVRLVTHFMKMTKVAMI